MEEKKQKPTNRPDVIDILKRPSGPLFAQDVKKPTEAFKRVRQVLDKKQIGKDEAPVKAQGNLFGLIYSTQHDFRKSVPQQPSLRRSHTLW